MKVRFQNGPDAPPIILAFEDLPEGSKGDTRQAFLDDIAARYGTVPEAAAWVDGEKPPKGLGGQPAIVVADADPVPDLVKTDGEAQKAEQAADAEKAPGGRHVPSVAHAK